MEEQREAASFNRWAAPTFADSYPVQLRVTQEDYSYFEDEVYTTEFCSTGSTFMRRQGVAHELIGAVMCNCLFDMQVFKRYYSRITKRMETDVDKDYKNYFFAFVMDVRKSFVQHETDVFDQEVSVLDRMPGMDLDAALGFHRKLEGRDPIPLAKGYFMERVDEKYAAGQWTREELLWWRRFWMNVDAHGHIEIMRRVQDSHSIAMRDLQNERERLKSNVLNVQSERAQLLQDKFALEQAVEKAKSSAWMTMVKSSGVTDGEKRRRMEIEED